MSTSEAGTRVPGGRLAWMDTLRGVAVFLVIESHAVVLGPFQRPEALLVSDYLGRPFRVPALMFLSGMLLPRSLTKPRWTYLRGKISRILWPYLVWSVIIAAVTSFGRPAPDPLVELFVNPTSATWFVGYLFVFYVVAMFFRPVARTWLLLPVAAGIVLAAPGDALDPWAHEHALGLHRFFFCFFCFLCGDLLARHATRALPVLMRRRTTAVCLVLALPALVMASAGFTVRYQPLYLVCTLAGIVALIPLASRFAGTGAGRFVAAQGRSSIVFYLVTWPVQLVAYHVPLALGVDDGVLATLFILCAGLAGGFAAVWLRSRVPAVDYLFDLHLERFADRRRAAARSTQTHGPGASVVRSPE